MQNDRIAAGVTSFEREDGCSVITAQRTFWNRVNLALMVLVPDRKSIVTWVTLVTTFSVAGVIRRRTGVSQSVRSPEYNEALG